MLWHLERALPVDYVLFRMFLTVNKHWGCFFLFLTNRYKIFFVWWGADIVYHDV